MLLSSQDLDPRVAVRAVLNLNERIFHFALGRDGIQIYLDYNVDVFAAALVDERLPQEFVARRYQQMREKLLEKRERLKRARE